MKTEFMNVLFFATTVKIMEGQHLSFSAFWSKCWLSWIVMSWIVFQLQAFVHIVSPDSTNKHLEHLLRSGTLWCLERCCSVTCHVQLFVNPWTAAHQASMSSTISWSLLKFMSIESVVLSNISSSAACFSFCLQSFPASGDFPVGQFFTSGGQSIGASASALVLPMNIQDWFPLGLVWFPCSPRDSQESSPVPQFKSISSSVLSLLYGSALTSTYG